MKALLDHEQSLVKQLRLIIPELEDMQSRVVDDLAVRAHMAIQHLRRMGEKDWLRIVKLVTDETDIAVNQRGRRDAKSKKISRALIERIVEETCDVIRVKA